MAVKRAIIIIGPPGSGKGTQADLLVQKNNILPISPGAILRNEIKQKTTLGKKIAKYVNGGMLVPGNLVTDIILKKLKAVRKSFILDGFPRSIDQAELLNKFLLTKKNGWQRFVLEIDVPNVELYKRIGGRRSCHCGKIYHLELNPPKKRGICDFCGSKLKVRADSKHEVIQERLRVYDNQTKPLIKFFKGKKEYKYVKIDGQPAIKKVHERVYNKIMK